MNNQHAVITGGAGSLGLAAAKQLVEIGCSVSLIDKNEDSNKKAKELLGDLVTVYTYDASKKESIQEFSKTILEKEGKITYLVNTVANNPHLPFKELTCEHMHKIVEEGLLAYAYTIRCFWDGLKENGSIVNVSSVHGTTTKYGNSMYAASKAGVESLTRALAAELREKKVRINAVAPGGFTSEFYVNEYPDWKEKLDKGQIFTPEDMANVVMFLLGDNAKAVNGETIIADGGVFTVRANSSDW